MIAAPWYLLSGGIVLVIVGLLWAGMGRADDSRRFIDPRMSDGEIAEQMAGQQRPALPQLLIFIGIACVGVSLVWRILRILF